MSSLSERNARILFFGDAVRELAETASGLPAGTFVQLAEMTNVVASRNKTKAFMLFTAASFQCDRSLATWNGVIGETLRALVETYQAAKPSLSPVSDKLLTNYAKRYLIQASLKLPKGFGDADLYMTVAYDKGKPAVRQGRKAVSLFIKA